MTEHMQNDGLNTEQILETLRRRAQSDPTTPEALAFANQDMLAALQDMGESAIEAICEEVLRTDSPVALRILLVEVLAFMTEGANRRIARTLMEVARNDQEPDSLRLQALQWLGKVGDPEDGRALLEWLKSTDNDRYEFALTRAVGLFPNDDVVPVLKDMLHMGKHHLTPIAAIRGLQNQKRDLALPILRDALKNIVPDSADDVQKAATVQHLAHALGALRDSDSIESLQSVMTDARFNISVRSAAAESLGVINTADSRQTLLKAIEQETNASLLVYVARGLSLCGKPVDAPILRRKAASVEDEYLVSVLQNVAAQLEGGRQ